jgi:2-polyprenyl-3-methyl-5-hydroxy-6-metoxy-1,4-benzoquinol methylase
MQPDEKFYEEIQRDRREDGGYSLEKIQFILEKSGSDKTILDIGCNEGHIATLLKKQGNMVHGTDIVQSNIKKAKKKGILAIYHDITDGQAPYKNETFDVVVIADVIEHIFDTDKVFEEAYRLLKPGGKIILTTPNVASLGRRMMLLCGVSPILEFSTRLPTNNYPSVGHIRYYTIHTMTTQLVYHKFRNIHIQGADLNFGLFHSTWLGKIFPSFSSELLVIAEK